MDMPQQGTVGDRQARCCEAPHVLLLIPGCRVCAAALADTVTSAALAAASARWASVSVTLSVTYLAAMPGGEEVEIDATVGSFLGVLVRVLFSSTLARVLEWTGTADLLLPTNGGWPSSPAGHANDQSLRSRPRRCVCARQGMARRAHPRVCMRA